MNTYLIADTYSKTGVCIVTKYSATGSILWEYTLTGYFTVTTGVSSVCTGATYSQYSNSSSWTFSEGGTSYSGNNAYGKGKFTYKVLFIVLQNVIIDIRVSCDEYGNIY